MGAFDLNEMCAKDNTLRLSLELENQFERVSTAVFHINSRVMHNSVEHKNLTKTQWEHNNITNVALLVFDIQTVGKLKDLVKLGEKILTTRPKFTKIGSIIFDIVENLKSNHSSKIFTSEFGLSEITINDKYNSFITSMLSKCTCKRSRQFEMVEILNKLRKLKDMTTNKEKIIALGIVESTLRQTANAIPSDAKKFTIQQSPLITLNYTNEINIVEIIELLENSDVKDVTIVKDLDVLENVVPTLEIDQVLNSQKPMDEVIVLKDNTDSCSITESTTSPLSNRTRRRTNRKRCPDLSNDK